MCYFRALPKPKTAAERQARLQRILQALDQLYPNVTCATILSAQCTDERVNKVTPGLFKKYPTIEDFAAVSQDELAVDVKSTGFFNNKAKSIRGAAKRVLEEFSGQIPRTMEEMLTIPGAARKTANVVLGSGFGIPSGVVVDTHVQRITNRLDLTEQQDPVKIEQDLMKLLPQERWILFAHQIIHFGRGICVARKPRCAECPLAADCYSKDKTI
jgi:endonuclease-3